MGAITISKAMTIKTAAIGVALAAALAAGPAVSAAVQEAKYRAPISVTSGTVTMRATATFGDGSSADRLYRVKGDADSDGDGIPDEIWLRVACSGAAVTDAQAYSLSGHGGSSKASVKNQATWTSSDPGRMAAGKRQHTPFKLVRELEYAREIGSKVSWDLKSNSGGRMASGGKYNWDLKSNSGKRAGKATPQLWHKVKLHPGAAELCN